MSAETPGTDHDDTEGQDADVLALMREIGPIVEVRRHYGLSREDAEVYARTVLASDWLATYVARKVEPIEQENRWNELACEGNQRLFAETLERAEKAERERDEARAAIERVTALAASLRRPLGGSGPFGAGSPEQRGCDYAADRLDATIAEPTAPASDRPEVEKCSRCGLTKRAALAGVLCEPPHGSSHGFSATEPAFDRTLTLDEHLAEVERRISLRACITGTDRHLDIVRAYREEVRRG